MTNLLPSAGNVLSATLNGFTVNYTVPTNATVASVATGLAAALNAQTNSTRVQAYAVGDRLELQSLDVTVPGSNVTLSASAALGSAAQLTTLLTPGPADLPRHHCHGLPRRARQQHPGRGRLAPARFTKTNGTPGDRQRHQHHPGHHHCHARPEPAEPGQREPGFAVRRRRPRFRLLRRRHLLRHHGRAVYPLCPLARLACVPNPGHLHRLNESSGPAVRNQPPPGQPHRPAAPQSSLRQLGRCLAAGQLRFSTPPASPTASIS